MSKSSFHDVESFLGAAATEVERRLDELLPRPGGRTDRLASAMRHASMSGGKRFRPAVCMLACSSVGGEPFDALDCASAIEMVHSYSLIHDDLPAMDDADLRRGKASCHVEFGEAHAILAGDALLTLAFEVLGSSYLNLGGRLALELARGAGWSGMIAGQAADIEAEGTAPDEESVSYIHLGKTAALIAASARMGALVGGADSAQIESITEFARGMGHAFQIVDDVLDETVESGASGKSSGIDRQAGKATYPAVMGIEKSMSVARALTDRAVRALEGLPDPGMLADLALRILRRPA